MLHISFQLLSEIVPDPPDSDAGCLGRKARRAGKRARKAKKDDSREVSLQLYQDLGILSREQGDTGKSHRLFMSLTFRQCPLEEQVCIRSRQHGQLTYSLFFAKHVLQQHHSTPRNKSILFDYPQLARANVLELGCGTGLLAILLSPLCTSYTASDLLVNLQLCSRNLQLNSMFPDDRSGSKVTMQEIDWFDMPTVGDTEPTTIGDYSLILAIDCVYNEALAIPLINTMTRYCRPGSSTMALVVVELRSSDVVCGDIILDRK